MRQHIAYLKSLRACSEATAFAEQYGSMQEAWEACRRPDWMMWLLSRVNHQDDRAYRRYACWCVRNTPMADGRTVWDMLTDDRSKSAVAMASRAAVAVAEQFADGEELVSARAAADAAYVAADVATDAARAAYYAAAHDAGRAAAAAAHDAGRAAAAAARAAADGSAADAAAYAAYVSAHAAYVSARASADAAIRVSARASADAAYVAALDAQSSYLRELFPWHVIEPLLSI